MKHALLFLLVTTPAVAQPRGAQADVLFKRGVELMSKGDIGEACAAFEASEKLEASTGTVIRLADCRERNAQLASAWGLYLQAERELRGVTDANAEQLRTTVKARAAALEPRLSKLTITVGASSRLPELEIIRDNDRVEPGAWNQPLPIDGGTYKVSARAPGHREWTTTVTIKRESDAQIVDVPKLSEPTPPSATPVTPPPAAVAPPPPPSDDPPPSPPPSGAHYTLPIAVAGGAVALGGTAIGFALASRSAHADYLATSNADALHAANLDLHIAQGLGLAAIACAGVSAYLFATAGHDLAVAPSATADGASVTLRGTW